MSGAGPSLFPGELPAWSVFKFPPDAAPAPIPPPYDGPSWRSLFPIPADLYAVALDPKVPLTIASTYAATVFLLNWYNRRNGNKPWAISKTRPFFAFVILHNVFLAVYSAVTCVAAVRTLKVSFPSYDDPNVVVGTIDALCKMHGPRGLGDAVTYNTATGGFASRNPQVQIGSNGLPEFSDVGRFWNEGLAFWGWIFYLSKFYEVLDTVIILAKGKRSTTLQTYHHAGAMLSMWAGMRYMSPPIWMFVLVNSGIHAMMYTYYTVSALGFRVPNAVKRTLTTLQITQFLVGASFAGIHLFVSYTVPVSVPYLVKEAVSSVEPVSSISSAISTASPALATATGAGVAFLKKLVYRAAGEEGLAENIPDPALIAQGIAEGIAPVQQVIKNTIQRTIHRTEYQHVPCIDTSGQAFAIYLNLIYLAPLTGLFMRFFVKSYLRRTSPSNKHATKKNVIAKSTHDAIHGVDREIESLGKSAEDGFGSAVSSATKSAKNGSIRGRTAQANAAQRAGSLSPANQKFVDSFNRKVKQQLENIGEGAEASKQRAKQIANEVVSGTSSPNRNASPVKENGASYAAVVKDEDVKANGNGNTNGRPKSSGKGKKGQQ
ncbi:hypothetical protein BU24DRAFT_89410 [Aaosphaeria arxii CBS 175.79]|uniref:Elongation of fatty acids protein n=1 Tax=Aaosphaeria arxii CBS 175.79 TaxID=1450172 RepID=A0A6A5X850_9PLEO|nr:uncharacterized protein BU24DRAFT_89410 [Aaosphaeria arxii CBS 175.79]KAF2008987.1 hypothetical protein BU24DRAFT_89410 [Aaosphaeria arxii CBS 175.79]